MSQLLPHTPMRPAVTAAIEKLERADTFDAAAFAVADRQRRSSGITFIAVMMPLFGVSLALIWVVDLLLAGLALPTFLYVFGAFLLAVLTHSALLRDRMRDDMRLGAAIERWQEKNGRMRETPLERKT